MWTVVFLAIMGRSAAYSVSLATDVNASAERRQLQPFGGQAYPGGCTSGEPDFNVPAAISTSDCLPERAVLRYPEDFGRLRSWVEHCVDEEKGERQIRSNGLPPHTIKMDTRDDRPSLCAARYKVTIPLRPQYKERPIEVASGGPIAFSVSGVPIYSAAWAVYNRHIFTNDASLGHPGSHTSLWHYHLKDSNSYQYVSSVPAAQLCHPGSDCAAGGKSVYPKETELIGYALDGFAIYGPLDSVRAAAELDECNGRRVGGSYQYHVRLFQDIDTEGAYCERGKPANRWNFALGCYHGDISQSSVKVDYDSVKGGAPKFTPTGGRWKCGAPATLASGREGVWVVPGGHQGACRARVGSTAPCQDSVVDGCMLGDYQEAWGVNHDECRSRCAASAECVAYEYLATTTRCELHKAKVTHTVASANFLCFAKG